MEDIFLGMGVVVLLILIAVIIWLYSKFKTLENNYNKNIYNKGSNSNLQIQSTGNDELSDEEEIVAVINAAIQASIDDDQDLAVAITAAIMAYEEENTPTDGLIVRSIRKKTNKSTWLRA